MINGQKYLFLTFSYLLIFFASTIYTNAASIEDFHEINITRNININQTEFKVGDTTKVSYNISSNNIQELAATQTSDITFNSAVLTEILPEGVVPVNDDDNIKAIISGSTINPFSTYHIAGNVLTCVFDMNKVDLRLKYDNNHYSLEPVNIKIFYTLGTIGEKIFQKDIGANAFEGYSKGNVKYSGDYTNQLTLQVLIGELIAPLDTIVFLNDTIKIPIKFANRNELPILLTFSSKNKKLDLNFIFDSNAINDSNAIYVKAKEEGYDEITVTVCDYNNKKYTDKFGIVIIDIKRVNNVISVEGKNYNHKINIQIPDEIVTQKANDILSRFEFKILERVNGNINEISQGDEIVGNNNKYHEYFRYIVTNKYFNSENKMVGVMQFNFLKKRFKPPIRLELEFSCKNNGGDTTKQVKEFLMKIYDGSSDVS